MQLDLFLDNQRTIRLNEAHHALLSLELEKAIKEYRRILADHPEDEEIRLEKELVEEWGERLQDYDTLPSGVERAYRLYRELKKDIPSALNRGILSLLAQELQGEQSPELIFRPPRFHIGCLFLDMGNYVEAQRWFARALENGIEQRGRFLAYQGDALTLMDYPERSGECYLSAFRQDPWGVDLHTLQNRDLLELIEDLEMEGRERKEIVSHLPVWGWLRGIFTLNLSKIEKDPAAFAADLARMDADHRIDASRLWFEYLRYAEYLRTRFRNDQEMIRVRRRMKKLAPGLFDEYMKKLGMAAISFDHPG